MSLEWSLYYISWVYKIPPSCNQPKSKLTPHKFGTLSIHDELQLGKLQFSFTFRILNGSHLFESQYLYF